MCLILYISLLGIRFYIQQELEVALFVVLIISLIVTFILDTIISHKIYKARTNKYGDILTIFNILSLDYYDLYFFLYLEISEDFYSRGNIMIINFASTLAYDENEVCLEIVAEKDEIIKIGDVITIPMVDHSFKQREITDMYRDFKNRKKARSYFLK